MNATECHICFRPGRKGIRYIVLRNLDCVPRNTLALALALALPGHPLHCVKESSSKYNRAPSGRRNLPLYSPSEAQDQWVSQRYMEVGFYEYQIDKGHIIKPVLCGSHGERSMEVYVSKEKVCS